MDVYQENISTPREQNSFAFPLTPPPCQTDCQSTRFNSSNQFSCKYKWTCDMVSVCQNSASGINSPQMVPEVYTGRWTESNQCNDFNQNYHLHRYVNYLLNLKQNKIN